MPAVAGLTGVGRGIPPGSVSTAAVWLHINATSLSATTQAKRMRMILVGMYSTAVRFGVVAVNPIREAQPSKAVPNAVIRESQQDDLDRVRAAVRAYTDRSGPGPQPGRLLPAFVDLLIATGGRPNEILALRWSDCDLGAEPPTITIRSTLIDHGRIAEQPLHRQDKRKGDAPEHTVLFPRVGVEALEALRADGVGDGPVFSNRDGGRMSLANMRRSLRAALPQDLQKTITPHTFRRAVATEVRNKLGADKAQQQLSHAKLATTEKHYCNVTLTDQMCARCWTNTWASRNECGGKVATPGRVAYAAGAVRAGSWCARRDSNP